MRQLTTSVFVVALLSAGSGLAAPGGLGEADSAAGALDRAARAFAEGKFRKARVLLEQTRAQTRDPALLARVYLQLGSIALAENDQQQAQAFFERALEQNPLLELDERRNRPETVRELESVRQRGAGELLVLSDPPGEVWLNERRAGQTPLRRLLFHGHYVVRVELPDGRSRSRSVSLRPGTTSSVELTFPSPAIASHPMTFTRDAREPRRKRPKSHLWSWIAGGAAVTAVAVGTALAISAHSDERAGCELLVSPPDACDRRSQLIDPDEQKRYLQLRNRVDDKQLGAAVSWSLAATCAASALLIYWLQRD